MEVADRIVLAVDAGGSTTRCLVARSDGTVLGFGEGGPANHILAGWETACASLRHATEEALRRAGLTNAPIAVAITGSAGVGPNGEAREPVESFLRELLPNAAVVEATGDMVAAFWGALRVPVGVVVSAGTGSVCFGRNHSGATCQVGGWGHVMGDEGSAYDIATQALRAVARAADGRAEATALTSAVAAALGGESAFDVAIRVYGEPLAREGIAALARHVAAAGRGGDAVAAGILRRAGEELALAAGAALRRLELFDVPATVSFAGSVFEAGELLFRPFEDALRAMHPRVRVEAPLLPPVGGAFRLGLEQIGEALDEEAIERLRAGLSRGAA